MKKKSYAARLGALAVALTMMTASLMGGTLAKYTSNVEGTGTALVAKWAVKAGDADGAETITAFKLGEANSGVVADKIAPGTSGDLPVYINLTGTEVATKVVVEVWVEDTTKLPTNFVMKYVDKDKKENAVTLESGKYVEVYSVEKSASDANTFSTNGNIKWEWPFGTDIANDIIDTANGKNPSEASFKVKVTATQLEADPSSQPK